MQFIDSISYDKELNILCHYVIMLGAIMLYTEKRKHCWCKLT